MPRRYSKHLRPRRPAGDSVTPVEFRIVVDGNYVSAAGITAGLNGALTIASMLRARKVAEEIKFDLEYAPDSKGLVLA
jgi:hypothetical protein